MALLKPLEWLSAECSWDKEWQRAYTRKYRGWFSTSDDEFYVRTHCGFTPLQAHPSDSGTRITDIKINLQSDVQSTAPTEITQAAFPWTITVEYGYIDPLTVTEDGNPLNKPATFRFEPDEEPEIVYVDVHKDSDDNYIPLLNKAGVPFNPPVERPRGKGVLTVLKNLPADFDFITAYDYCYYRTNDATWTIFAENTIRSVPFRLPEIAHSQEANVYYYPMEFTFLYDPNTWKKRVLNAGVVEIDPSDSSKLRAICLDGQPTSEAQLLDEDGHALAIPVSPESIVFLDFDVYESRDYSWFGFDDLFTLPGA